MNKIMIIGSLGADPTTRTLPSGVSVCTFNVAVNGRGKDAETQWFRVSAWRQLAENCQRFLAKGRKVAVVGSVSLNTYTNQAGQSRSSMEVNADEVEFLTPRSDADDSGLNYTPPKVDGKSGMVVIDDDETLPF